jgi:hypothetical protein
LVTVLELRVKLVAVFFLVREDRLKTIDFSDELADFDLRVIIGGDNFLCVWEVLLDKTIGKEKFKI